MKVKCYIIHQNTDTEEAVEVEIPDEFRKLTVAHPWEDPNITEDVYSKCIDAVEFVTGIPFYDDFIEFETYICAVYSAEDNEIMLEI